MYRRVKHVPVVGVLGRSKGHQGGQPQPVLAGGDGGAVGQPAEPPKRLAVGADGGPRHEADGQADGVAGVHGGGVEAALPAGLGVGRHAAHVLVLPHDGGVRPVALRVGRLEHVPAQLGRRELQPDVGLGEVLRGARREREGGVGLGGQRGGAPRRGDVGRVDEHGPHAAVQVRGQPHVGHREHLAGGGLDVDGAAVQGQHAGVEPGRRGKVELGGPRLARLQREGLGQRDLGRHVARALGHDLLVPGHAGRAEDGRVRVEGLHAGEGRRLEGVGDGGGAAVGHVDLVVALKVVRVVEGEAGEREGAGVVEHLGRVDEPRADLVDGGQRRKVPAALGAVVPGHGLARRDEAHGQLLGEAGAVGRPAAVFADVQRSDAGDVGAAHRGAGLRGVAALEKGGKDLPTGRRDVGLDGQLVGGADAGEGAGHAAVRVGDAGHAVAQGQVEVGQHATAAADGLDDALAVLPGDHGDVADAAGVVGPRDDEGLLVVVKHYVPGAPGLEVPLLDRKGAGAAAGEHHHAGEVHGVVGERVAGLVGHAGVEADGVEWPVDHLGWRPRLAGPVRHLLAALRGIVAILERGYEPRAGNHITLHRCHRDDVDARGSTAGSKRARLAIVASRDGDDDAALHETGCHEGPGVAADGRRDDVGAVLVRAQKRFDQCVLVRTLVLPKDLVRQQRGLGRDTSNQFILAGDDTSNMRAVALVVHGVIVGLLLHKRPVCISNQVVAADDLVPGPKGTPQSRVRIIDTAVHHGDLDALAQDAPGVQLVDARHVVHRDLAHALVAVLPAELDARLRAAADQHLGHHGVEHDALAVPGLADAAQGAQAVDVVLVRLDHGPAKDVRVEHLEHLDVARGLGGQRREVRALLELDDEALGRRLVVLPRRRDQLLLGVDAVVGIRGLEVSGLGELWKLWELWESRRWRQW
ncbi:hypothetical protein PoMZ_07165 [Pyricularia oryzae]|uniref:Uncharacterized protein n=1 Tax=Pyricularia oryzae TaxID=318829 RepID=A0A4P7NEF7_PYROR|nr:hypothetical protein PoMZ_07165 [Pyricularia oryzae]